MSYINAELILPKEILMLVQEYAGGQYLYIPQKSNSRKSWGTNTGTKEQIMARDAEIFQKYQNGTRAMDLAEEYYLSLKSIQRIISKQKSIQSEANH